LLGRRGVRPQRRPVEACRRSWGHKASGTQAFTCDSNPEKLVLSSVAPIKVHSGRTGAQTPRRRRPRVFPRERFVRRRRAGSGAFSSPVVLFELAPTGQGLRWTSRQRQLAKRSGRSSDAPLRGVPPDEGPRPRRAMNVARREGGYEGKLYLPYHRHFVYGRALYGALGEALSALFPSSPPHACPPPPPRSRPLSRPGFYRSLTPQCAPQPPAFHAALNTVVSLTSLWRRERRNDYKPQKRRGRCDQPGGTCCSHLLP
jgi:hypothetical protein